MPSATPTDDAAEDSDESLMLRYAGGDIAAFDALYGRHELGLWRFVLRSVRVQAVADDLTQDVWFAVARQASTYEVKARFKTWLFTIAHNRLVDHYRGHKNHVPLDGSNTSDGTDNDETHGSLAETLAADSGFGPLRQLQSREQAAALIAAVEQLAPDQREAFLLQAEAGMSVEDIAATTGVSFETAKSRLRYARRSLRQWLQEFA